MSNIKLKSIVHRGSMFGLVAAFVVSAFAPATSIFADALNPLTERSLTLSSSSPGWNSTDGSGNATYAPPNSGANGNKTGNTFSFRVSSTADIAGFTFQYCTTPAGNCMGPGNNTVTGTAGSATRAANGPTEYALKHSDLEVATSTPSEVSTFGSKFDTTTGAPSNAANVPNRDNSEGNYIVLYKHNVGDAWQQSTGWAMSASVNQTKDGSAGDPIDITSTGQPNYISLKNATTPVSLSAGDYVKVIFFATDTNYITNPGAGAFFVKINDYNNATTLDDTTLVDGGVTVANVMNQSIEIQTKVLETMSFSVGTVDPTTLTDAELSTATAGAKTSHAPCDTILGGMNPSDPVNVLKLGDENGENSLSTEVTYSTHSYWRLSSNSSAGATVYYSGVTLSNTVGDQIDPIHNGDGIADQPHVGAEQFGLALANGTLANNSPAGSIPTKSFQVDYSAERDGTKNYESAADNGKTGVDASTTTEVGGNASYHAPQLYPLQPGTNYQYGAGTVNANYDGSGSDPIDTQFAFDTQSNLIPTPIASESSSVVDCVTGKMRYIANIAATTPAGIYTTKINYIAAPQY